MTPPSHPSLLSDDPGELIAAIPGLLSFHPADSVVLVTYTGLRRPRLESLVRLDIPDPEHIPEVAAQLRQVLRGHSATLVDLIMLGGPGADPPTTLPARDLVQALSAQLDMEDVALTHAVWASRIEAGGTWWCYADPTCTGQIRDPRTSPLTLELAAAGEIPYPNREALATLLAPDPEPALARRATLIAAHPPADPQLDLDDLRATLDTITARIRTDPHHPIPDLDDPTLARLAIALATPPIREACLAFALTHRAHAAELLFTTLTRMLPAPARANPASLLGVTCYLRGDGARAAIALDAALAADPTNRLTQTLNNVLTAAIPPRQFRTILAESFAASFANQ